MRLTAFSDVSLRVLMLLSGTQDVLLSTQKIAEGVGTPYNHVAKSVSFLSSYGLVESSRGRAGGVRLSEKGRKATVGQVLRLTEKQDELVDCFGESTTCPLAGGCSLKGVLANAREQFYLALEPVVISELPTERQMGPVMLQLGLGPLAGSV
ncbi:RrF2 family transcriptional regulator [Rothia nasimurium]|uniref:RrF2 family transcriptional regulator n=1 Tax=Rothia nasimurium TaxID=85336 RepID=UPI001F37117B|nr:Rrf2 family transcriptional regulator [Rothia nasimurium]